MKNGRYKLAKAKVKFLNSKVDLIQKMGDKAVDAALASNNERLDTSNHKYALLKEQQSQFATKTEVALLTKLVYVGVGMIIVIEFVFKYLMK